MKKFSEIRTGATFAIYSGSLVGMYNNVLLKELLEARYDYFYAHKTSFITFIKTNYDSCRMLLSGLEFYLNANGFMVNDETRLSFSSDSVNEKTKGIYQVPNCIVNELIDGAEKMKARDSVDPVLMIRQ